MIFKKTTVVSILFVGLLLAVPASAEVIQMLPPVQSGTLKDVCAKTEGNKVLSWDGTQSIKCQTNVTIDDEGRVGIGTMNPPRALSVMGSGPNVLLYNNINNHANFGWQVVDSCTTCSPNLPVGSFAVHENLLPNFTGLYRFVIAPGGNVGINSVVPVAKLDVAGGIKVGDDPTCNAAKAGTIRFNSGVPQYCNGTAWVGFGGPPTGPVAWYGSDYVQISSYPPSGPGCASARDDAACPAGWLQVGIDICGGAKVAVLCQKY